jgi:hypothetical protein
MGSGESWEAESVPFSFPGPFKTYANLWQGKNMFPNQKLMSGVGHGWSMSQVDVVFSFPELRCE